MGNNHEVVLTEPKDAERGLSGVAHIFRFSNRVVFELVFPRGNSAVEALATLHGHLVTVCIKTDHGEAGSLEDCLLQPCAMTAF